MTNSQPLVEQACRGGNGAIGRRGLHTQTCGYCYDLDFKYMQIIAGTMQN
jgi:hypothetical protein